MNVKDECSFYIKRILKKKTLQALRTRDAHVSTKQFDDYRCIFIHIPKCAGIAVSKSLLGKPVGHLSALDYRMIFGKEDFNNYYKFTFVRNPFSRLVSAYEFMQNDGYGESDKNIVTVVKQYPTFQDFVLNHLTPQGAKRIRHFRPQHFFVCDSSNHIMVDFVGRFESIEQDYENIRNKIGVGEPLKKINATNGKRLSLDKYYENPRVLNKVIEIYHKDFEIFRYPTNIKQII
jgi:chondroitin 4-sulfotransferase 11